MYLRCCDNSRWLSQNSPAETTAAIIYLTDRIALCQKKKDDELASYDKLGREFSGHGTVNHSAS
jgi:hypothetical protein